MVDSRSTTADFFAMFDTPFLYGGGWDGSADDRQEYVVVNNHTFGGVEEVFFPLSVSIANEVGSNGNTNCWKPIDGNGYEAFLNSECIWMQFWVELHGREEVRQSLAFLDAYAESQQ